ncbi:ATP-binding protein [Geomonas azotofigens]|uniref:ATP-binding protein n=1 Tax=Geomonas azotofigens TaxID=2843196 RepID=UPI001C107A72|nr:ATP-binding protein [Geomonas azotofigens]MBU5613895.1 PAS domain-containing protein [Geomonas azotofigens]
MTKFNDSSIGSRLMLLVGIFLLGFALLCLFSFHTLDRVKINGPLYAHIIQNHLVIQDILPPPLYMVESRLNALQMLKAAEDGVDRKTLAGMAAQAAQLRNKYEQRYRYWMSNLPAGDPLTQILSSSHDTALRYYRAQDEHFLPALLAGSLKEAEKVDAAVLEPEFQAHRALIEKAVTVATGYAQRDENTAAKTISRSIIWLFVIGAVAGVIILLVSLSISRSISLPLAELSRAAIALSEGRLDTMLTSRAGARTEMGTLFQAFNKMATQLTAVITQLRASETKYRIVADNTFDWEFWRDPQGNYIYSSPSCQRITGYPPEEFARDQNFIISITHPDDRSAFDEHHRLALRPDSPPVSRFGYRLVAADGSERWIDHVCCPVFDESGRFLGKRGTNRDVTEQKKAEEQLVKAKEQAEEANKTKSAFISAMSHELRTPLNAIMGYSQILMRDSSLDATQHTQLKVIADNGQYLLSLINDILEIGKEQEESALEQIDFDLPALIGQVLDISRGAAEEKGLAFRYLAATRLPGRVHGDERKLRQVLLNLLDNAVRYTGDGGVTLRVTYHGERPGLLVCEVIDTGIGIETDNLEEIFEPFTQLGRKGGAREGAGLGLTVAHHLVSSMSGKLDVKSEPGRGSSFRLEIPLSAVAEGGVPVAASVVVEAAEGPTHGYQYRASEVPPPEMLHELYELAKLGDIRRIRLWAEKMMETSACHRFAEEVRELAGGFKAKAITALVARYLPAESRNEKG